MNSTTNSTTSEMDLKLLQMASLLKTIEQLPPDQRTTYLKNTETAFKQILANPQIPSKEGEEILKKLSYNPQNNFLQIHTQSNVINEQTLISDLTHIKFAEKSADFEEAIILPYGKPRYSKEDRHAMLEHISSVSLPNQKKIPPGCSIVLNLIADELLETYPLIRKENFRDPALIACLNYIFLNTELLLSRVMFVASRSSRFHGEFTQKDNYREIQENFVALRKKLVNDNNQLILEGKLVSIKYGAPVKRFLNVLNLLEDFVTQEMHVLFRPINDMPEMTSHLERLKRRTTCLQTLLDKDFLYDQMDKKTLNHYSNDIKELKNFLNLFCKNLISCFEKLQGTTEFKNYADLWRYLESLQFNPTPQIYLDCKNNPQNQWIKYLQQISSRLGWSFQTLKDEAYLVLISELLNHGMIQNEEIDDRVEELINVKKILVNYDFDSIEKRLNQLSDGMNGVKDLHVIWADFKSPKKKQAFNAIVLGLEYHLKKCHEKPDDQLERALMLRKALYSLGKHTFCINSQYRQNIANFKLKNLEAPLEVMRIVAEMEELNDMEYNAALMAVEAIKSLICRGFMEIESSQKAVIEQKEAELQLQSLQAKQAGDKLSANEKKPAKPRKNPKSLPQRTKKTQTKKTAINNSMKEKITVSLSKIVVAEEVVVPEEEIPQDKPQQLPALAESLVSCENLLITLKNSPLMEDDNWQCSQVDNLSFLVENILEKKEEAQFSADHIFEQIDFLRRSVEAVLEIATIYSKAQLSDIRKLGHNSEKLLYMIMEEHLIPENIRKLLWNLRSVPLSLAEANRCVNYPEQSHALKRRFKNSGKELIDFLINVDREKAAIIPNEALRKQLVEAHEERMRFGVYFVERLLHVLSDPFKEVEGVLPEKFAPLPSLQDLLIEDFSAHDSLNSEELFSTENGTEKIILINNRDEALFSIDKALAWIAIRCTAPVEGVQLMLARMEGGNIALKNCAVYFRRLKEKLGPERSNRPMSTVLGQCGLVRRIQKELSIAALYHNDSFKDGKHTIEAFDIRYENSPIVLMNLLKASSKNSKEIPHLSQWLHQVHGKLSYPTPLDSRERHFTSDHLDLLIKEVVQASKEMRKPLEEGWTHIKAGEKMTSQKLLESRNKLVKENEAARIYPEIGNSLQILKKGLSLPTSNYL
jgi:hypothetical protein